MRGILSAARAEEQRRSAAPGSSPCRSSRLRPSSGRHLAAAACFCRRWRPAWGWWQARARRGASSGCRRHRRAATPAIAAHVRGALRRGRAAADLLTAVGALCLAYHADMLFAPRRALLRPGHALDPANWRWVYYRAVLDAERGGGAATRGAPAPVVDASRRSVPHGCGWATPSSRPAATRRPPPHGVGPAAGDPPARRGHRPTHRVRRCRLRRPGAGARGADHGRCGAGRRRARAHRRPEAPASACAVASAGRRVRALGRTRRRRGRVPSAGPPGCPSSRPTPIPMVDALARESRNGTLLLRLASDATLSANAEWSELLTRRALEFDPDNPEAVAKMGRILRTFGRDEEALTLLPALSPPGARRLPGAGADRPRA